jgi:PAS domain S-box-containing protein
MARQPRKLERKASPTRGKLRRTEDHFRQLVEGVDDYGILLLDPVGRISSWNSGAARVTGFTADEVIGRSHAEFYTPEARSEGIPARHLEEAARTGRLADEGWCLRKDGSRFWASFTITAVVGTGGNPRCFLIIARDLTQRREMEQQIHDALETAQHEAELRLRESEERFARFTEHLPGLAWIKDLAGRYVYINRAGAQVFGRSPDEICGATDAELFPPETVAQFRENDAHAIAQGIGVQVVEHLVHPDGSVHHSIVSKFPIQDAQGEVRLIGGIAIDITERVRAEEALLLADRRKDEFLATLSHELRNPLAPLRNSLHLLQSHGADSRTERMYGMMEQQLNRMIRLVDDLLEVSRITGGKIELRKEPVSVATVIESAIETSRPLIESASHRLTVMLPDEPLVIEADPVRITQVLSNLLNNAAKYTQEAGSITLSGLRDGDDVVLAVRDNGLGIPANMLPRVFEMFAQVDRTLKRSQGGLGIGLALARSLVEMHGGSITARSEGLNAGSEFVVRLPLSRHRQANPSRAQNIRSSAPGAGLKILVVDDNQDGADTMAMVLQTLGATASVAYDGPSAIAAVRSERPDLVLLDLGMPAMDGYEVAAQIRADPVHRQVRLIALTGFGSEEERRRCREAGFDDHCTKPCDPQRLREILATNVASRE